MFPVTRLIAAWKMLRAPDVAPNVGSWIFVESNHGLADYVLSLQGIHEILPNVHRDNWLLYLLFGYELDMPKLQAILLSKK